MCYTSCKIRTACYERGKLFLLLFFQLLIFWYKVLAVCWCYIDECIITLKINNHMFCWPVALSAVLPWTFCGLLVLYVIIEGRIRSYLGLIHTSWTHKPAIMSKECSHVKQVCCQVRVLRPWRIQMWKDALNSLSMRTGDASHFSHEKCYIVNTKQLVFNHSNWQKKPCC